MGMNRNSAIALYDSGRGVESVLKVCQKLLPHEKWLILQDNDSPYGSKSDQEIIERGFSCFAKILQRDVKAIVVACHTSSAIAMSSLSRHFSVPMVGMLRPTARLLAECHTTDNLIWLATPASVKADRLEPLARQLGYRGQLFPVACDQWVDCIENNQLDKLECLLQLFSNDYGDLIYNRGAKIIYGCTHYPLLEGLFNRVFGDCCVCIDPAVAVGHALKYQLMQNDMLRMDKSPSVKFLNGMAFQWSDCLALQWSDCLV